MKIKYIILFVTIILITLFSGCSRSSTTDTAETATTVPSHIEKTLDTNLEVNADVIAPTSSMLPTYAAHIYEPSVEQVQKAFFNDAAESALEITYQSKESDDEDGYKIKYKNRMFHYLGIQIYANYDYYEYLHLFSCYPDSIYELPKDFEAANVKDAGNLAFMTKEEAINKVNESANSLGLYLEEEPFTCIALNSESLTTLYNYVGGNPELFYSEEDISFENDEGCYLIVWDQKSNTGESVLSENHSANTRSGIGNCRGTYIVSIVNKEGIVAFDTRVNYENTKKKQEEKIISVDSALDCIKEKYSNIILNSPITITEIKFCYSYTLVDKNSLTYESVPTWSILSYDSANDSYSLTTVNAVTGELF